MKDRYNLLIAIVFLVVVAAIGGASRADALSQTPLRLLAIGFLVAGLWAPNRVRMARSRALFFFPGLTILLPALQLIPLPHDIWAAVPGHGFYAGIADAIGLEEAARPLSLVPSMTWNALLSLLVPAAMLVLATQVSENRLARLALVILAIGLGGMILGFAQGAGGARSALRLYRVTNTDSMVGLFANRNHHAVLLAITLPVLCALPIGFRRNETWRRIGMPLSALSAVLVGVTLLLTGSRAGLLAGAIGALGGAAIYASMASAQLKTRARHDRLAHSSVWFARLRHPLAAPLSTLALITIAALGFANTPAMQRLLKTNMVEEDRAKLLSPILHLTSDLMPFGGGFGSFNNLFRHVESVEFLRTTYLNHAHMDVLQIVTEGGLPAAALLLAFLVWWTRRAVAAWRQPRSVNFDDNLGRIATISTGILIVASAVDYPLRTPLHMAVFVIGCVWLQRAGARKAV